MVVLFSRRQSYDSSNSLSVQRTNAYLPEQLVEGPYNTADEYIQALIQQDTARKEHLEPLILEGLASGDATPMTTADWDNIRAITRSVPTELN